MIESLFFIIFALLTLVCALMVVANPFSRNPVTSAMFLVLTIISMAGLFVLLNAFFLAAVQVLVYAGAVIVLFLFVIMLMDVEEEERRRVKHFAVYSGMLVSGVVAIITLTAIMSSGVGASASSNPLVQGSAKSLGKILFQNYLLPFEILSILLLVAMVGAILLSKKDLK